MGGEESFENVEVELIDGNKEGVVWLLINLVHIAYKQSVTKTTVKFQLSALASIITLVAFVWLVFCMSYQMTP